MPALAQKISTLLIPMLLNQWLPNAVHFKGTPKLSLEGKAFRIETVEAAGGYIYLLPEPVTLTKEKGQFRWKWSVQRFPQKVLRLPLTKKTDDFAVRIGLLLSDGTSKISLPSTLQAKLNPAHPLSYVLFYCASPQKETTPVCEQSPYQGNFVNCMKRASGTRESNERFPWRDLASVEKVEASTSLQVIGVWLFADSDNNGTRSEAHVSGMELFGF
ncbi:MAG: DUF3047 domain-containing protein [Bdellovibrionota bacterium]